MDKAELHLHLEGSVDPDALRELDPALDAAALDRIYGFGDFGGFLESFTAVVRRLRAPEDYALITRRLLARLAEENVKYAEITLSAGVVLWKEQDFAAVWDAVRAAACHPDVQVRWILDAVRHFGPDHAMEVAELAAARVAEGAVAFGIGGDEARGPAEWFGDVYDFARRSGLRLTAHAGETAGPESVWAALEIGAERIGHGIAAARDPLLMRHLADRRIPLEICLTSNLRTGAVPRLEVHPLRTLYEAGVPVTLNTDDPGLFATTLEREYHLATRALGFSEAELAGIARAGFEFAFAGPGGI